MNTELKKSVMTAAFMALGGLASQAGAQEVASGSTEQGDAKDYAGQDIIVTAQKRAQNLQDVPASITAITPETLGGAPLRNISDVQTLVPSLNISGRNSSGVVTLRGIGFAIFTPGAEGSVAIHSDGIYASRPILALSGMYDVASIEVARGPQGTLYGRNATGGAVNIISNKPTDDLTGYVNFDFGNYSALTLSGAVSGPLVKDKLLFRVAAKSSQRDGYGKNLFNGQEVDDLNTRAVRAQLLFRASDSVSFLLQGDYFKENDAATSNSVHSRGCVDPVCGPAAGPSLGFPLPSDLRNVDVDIQPRNIQEHGMVSLTTDVDLGFADLKSLTAYREGTAYYIFDFDATRRPGSFLTREEDHHEFSQELNLTGKVGDLDWLLGAYYFSENNLARANGNLQPPLGQYFQGGRQITKSYAAYADVTYHLTEKLSLNLGARMSFEDKRVEDEHTFAAGPSGWRSRAASPTPDDPCVSCANLPSDADFKSFTPKFGLSYDVSDDVKTYVTIQKGFKSGGFSLGSVTPAFEPEEIWSYEAGVKARWLDRRLTTNLSVFHYDYSNLQVSFMQPGGTATVTANAARAKVNGVELEAKAALSDAFSIDGNISYIDATFSDYLAPANPALNAPPPGPQQLRGNLLPNSPKWSGRISPQFMFGAAGGRVTAKADVFLSSRVYFSAYNDLRDSQKPYELVNASLRWESDDERWSLGAYVTNIFDKLVVSSSGPRSSNVGRILTLDLLPPRTYGINAGMKF